MLDLTLDSVREFPPIRWFRERRFDRAFLDREAPGTFRGVYRTFAEAEADLPTDAPIGYDQPGTGELYRELFQTLREWEYPVLYWLSRLLPETRSVFDFGGHIGILYYGFSRYLDFPDDFRWTVHDVPEVLRRGREIAEARRARHLSFASDLSPVDGHDLLLISGSQQYVENLLLDDVESVAHPPRRLIVNMLPLHDEMEFVTVSSMDMAFCPYKVFRSDRFLSELDRCGWVVRDRWLNPGKSCDVTFHPETHATKYHGFFCERG